MVINQNAQTVTTMRAYCWQTAAGNANVGIYDMSGNLLKQASNVALAAGLMTFTLTSSLTMTAGTRYYLAITFPNGALFAAANSGTGSSPGDSLSLAWQDMNNALPNPETGVGSIHSRAVWLSVQ